MLAVALPAWIGMRDADFLTPPDEATLDAIRTRTESALPRLATRDDAISPQGTGARVVADAQAVQLGNLTAPPKLDEYADRAARGAAHLIETATRLEDDGHSHRALLAWERVIDSAAPDSAELESAVAAVARLRPGLAPWNRDAAAALSVVLQAGTGKRSAETLEPVLKQTASDLERATSGILKLTTVVNTGADIDLVDGPVPVAIWLSGPAGAGQSSDVMSFTISTPDSIEYDLQRTLYQLIQNHFRRSENVRPPTPLPDEGDPRDALADRITRLHWHALGVFLNSAAENSETNP